MVPLCGPPLLFQLLDWARQHRLASNRVLPICVWGERGVGKTQIIAEYARSRALEFRVYHPAHDTGRGDLLGTSFRDPETNTTHYSPPSFLPAADDVAVVRPDGILLIDELNRADRDVISGLFELIGEGQISQSGYVLPEGWQIVCACNPPEPGYDVTDLDQAMIDRMLHVPFGFDPAAWHTWARRQALEEDVIDFVRLSPDQLTTGPRGLPAAVVPQPTPRAVEFFARLYEPQMDDGLLSLIAEGLLGTDAAPVFMASRQRLERELTAEQIINGAWRRYFPRWLENGRGDLLHKSLTALLRDLETRAIDPGIAQELIGIRDRLDARRAEILMSALAEHLPRWHELMTRLIDGRRRERDILFTPSPEDDLAI